MAATFALSYAALIVGVPAILSQFQDFKIEMSALTLIAIQVTRFFTAPVVGVVVGVVMLSLMFALAIGEKWAWWIGLALSLLFGLCLFSSLLPFISLINGLSGGDDSGTTHPQSSWLQLSPLLPGCCLPTILFLALRRSFWRNSQNQGQANAHAQFK